MIATPRQSFTFLILIAENRSVIKNEVFDMEFFSSVLTQDDPSFIKKVQLLSENVTREERSNILSFLEFVSGKTMTKMPEWHVLFRQSETDNKSLM